MSNKPNARRQPPATAVDESAADTPVEDVAEDVVIEDVAEAEDKPVPSEAPVVQAMEPQHEVAQRTEPRKADDDDIFSIASIYSASRSKFGVSQEVVAGALMHSSIYEQATVAQVRDAINVYLQLPV